MTSALEDTLAFQLDALSIPYTREYRALPPRKFRFDFAIEPIAETRLLVEVQGGTWGRTRSGHSTGAGIQRDCEKHNLAVLAGFRVLAFTSTDVRQGTAMTTIQEAYGR